MVCEIHRAKINPKSSFKNYGAQNKRGQKLQKLYMYIHLSSWCYSPGWALTSSTTILHCSLSFVFSIHCFIFITFKSATSSSHHKRGLPFLLPTIIFLGIAPTSFLFACPSHLILWAFINFTISSLFMDLFNSSLFLRYIYIYIACCCVVIALFLLGHSYE